MRKKICQFILHILGWKVEVSVPDYPKCVICVAPHTSNADFFLGKLAYLSIGRHAGFLIKKDWFFFPLNIILRSMGGIPVDRSKHTDLIDQIVREFETHTHFSVAITPEATRKKNPEWKKGFYFIALKANVPIVLAYIDYKEKSIGLKQTFIPTGNFEKELAEIKQFYKNYHAKYPDRFAI